MSKILVIKLSALGDFLQALGAMKAIRAYHPDAHITLLTTKSLAQMGCDCGYYNDVWVDEKPCFYDLRSIFRLRQKLRAKNFTRVYDLQNNDRTQLYFWLMQPRPPEWVGAACGASHRNASAARTAGKAFDGHRNTLMRAGLPDFTPDPLDWMTGDMTRFNPPEKFVLIVPGCAPTRPEKRWPVAHYAQLCNRLYAQGLTPVLLGTQAEADVTNEIAAACPGARNLTGQTSFYDLAALARAAIGAIGNDTGPMHLIALTGCPTLMLFSTARGSNPTRHGPLGSHARVLSAAHLDSINITQVFDTFSELTLTPRSA